MGNEKIYVKGLRTFKKNEKAPSFVLGSMVISVNELFAFIKENQQYLTEYNGTKQLKCQILEGEKGIYFTVDTYKKSEGITDAHAKTVASKQDNDDLPF